MPPRPNLHDFFTFGEVLGKGTFAQVILVTENATKSKFAMKMID
jgi:serine/threonine protein kinase